MQTDLFEPIEHCLNSQDPQEKVTLTRQLYSDWQTDGFEPTDTEHPRPIGLPGRPVRPRLVPPKSLPQRRLHTPAGRAALIHAVAHIEFNAINLALDAAYRFRGMPIDYYADWLSVAAEEARHFAMLEQRLGELGYGYGDFDAHDGLWQMAVTTAHSPLARMALVPRVMEARGLDVTPGMIVRLRSTGDEQTVTILETILREEIRHVAIGSRWFRYCCEEANLPVEETFVDLLKQYFQGQLRGPFNEPARLEAGFTARELHRLKTLPS